MLHNERNNYALVYDGSAKKGIERVELCLMIAWTGQQQLSMDSEPRSLEKNTKYQGIERTLKELVYVYYSYA